MNDITESNSSDARQSSKNSPNVVDQLTDVADQTTASDSEYGEHGEQNPKEPEPGSGHESATPHDVQAESASGVAVESGAEAGSGKEAESESIRQAQPKPPPSPLDIAVVERDQYLRDLQRVSAEFVNFRKQTEKRHAETVKQASVRLVQAILPVLDACDAAALQQVTGVEPIADQLRGVLENEGLEVINKLEAFDPNRHEAVISEPADEHQEVAMVAEILRTGYAFNGRVLRAAMVRVKG